MTEGQYIRLALKLDEIKEAILSDPLPDSATGLTTAVDELNQLVRELVDVLREDFGLWVVGGR